MFLVFKWLFLNILPRNTVHKFDPWAKEDPARALVFLRNRLHRQGLDPIDKKLQKIFSKSGQIFCFQEISTDFQILFL